MTAIGLPKISFWRTIVALIFAAGIYSMYARFALGFKAATNLTDPQPWGLWVGLGTLCGVGLSAGGFAIAAAVYLLGLERYRPILRTAVLISFLGYCTVCVGMLYELGIPWRIWHPIVMWNRHSVLFEVSWCVMLYTTVLALEFSPALVEKIPFVRLRELYLRWHHSILIALVLAGTLLSSMHQSFLGGLYLITKGRLDPLWYTPYLTTMFYLSAIPAGLAVTIMAIYLCVRSLNARVDMNILSDVSRVIAPLLAIYGVFRAVDLINRDALQYLWMWREATLLFWLEIALLVIAPLVLLNMKRRARKPAVSVLDLRCDRDGIYGESVERLRYRTPDQFRCVLCAEMDRVRGYVCNDRSGRSGVPLRRNLFGHFAQEPASGAMDGSRCSRRSVNSRAYLKPRAKSPGFFT